MSEPSTRPATDRCPGVLRPYASGDGALVRLRPAGARLRATTLAALTWYAAEHGAPVVQLTSRANLQLRGMPDPLPADLEPFVTHLDLLPSASHEVMRNLIAAPALTDLAGAYDEGLRAAPSLAALPGRWLVAFDDGSGELLSEPWDLAFQAVDDHRGVVRAATCPRGMRVDRADAVSLLLELSRAAVADLADAGDGVWNVRELATEARVFRRLTEPVGPVPPATAPLPGRHGEDLLVGVPLGLLDGDQAGAIMALCDQVQITPWRSIRLFGAADAAVEELWAVGLVTQPDDGFTRVTACVGAPHCARTESQTLAIARSLAADAPTVAVHVSGCERRCGQPRGVRDLIAPSDLAEARTMLADMEAR